MVIGNVEQRKKDTSKKESESGVAIWKLHREEQKSGGTSSRIHGEKKSSRLLKVARRSNESSDSESFEALETKPKLKFSVEDESSVMTSEGEETDDT